MRTPSQSDISDIYIELAKECEKSNERRFNIPADRRASSLDNQTGKPSLTPLSRNHARQRTKRCQNSDDSDGDHNDGDDKMMVVTVMSLKMKT